MHASLSRDITFEKMEKKFVFVTVPYVNFSLC